VDQLSVLRRMAVNSRLWGTARPRLSRKQANSAS
jgi:hypothetical protein